MHIVIGLMLVLVSSLGALTKDLIGEEIEKIIQSVDPTALVGIKVHSIDEEIDLYERNAASRFVPGSTLKLFTAAAALERLGKEDSFKTEVVSDGKIERGVLKGNCFLVGSGDPSLTALDLVELVTQMGEIKKIEGDLILDLSCFEDDPKGPGWMWHERAAFWSVPMSPLNIEHNCIDETAILEPEKLTAALFQGILEKKGIVLEGEVKIGKAPRRAQVLATHLSEPIKELIKPILKMSDNLYADCLFKKMGGSWEKGRKEVETFLEECIGLNPEELVVVDGSGLSRYNLVSPNQMVEFLKKMRGNQTLREALPIGNEDGTLKWRMENIHGKVIAKTGVMTGVTSLCGYLTTDSGQELAIAIFSNGHVKKGWEIKTKMEDSICQLLVSLEE